MPPHSANVPSGDVKYHPVTTESDRLSTYMGLDDTLFEARHGRGALDNVPRIGGEVITTSSIGITPVTSSTGMIVNPRIGLGPSFDGLLHPSQRESISVSTDPSVMGHRVASSSFRSHNLVRCCNIYRHDGNNVDYFGLTNSFVN